MLITLYESFGDDFHSLFCCSFFSFSAAGCSTRFKRCRQLDISTQSFVCTNQAVQTTKPLVHKTVNLILVKVFLFLTAKQNFRRSKTHNCALCVTDIQQKTSHFVPTTEGLCVFPFDQERPCLCIVWTFLHRCFVLRNLLLNNVVWLTMDLVCGSWRRETVIFLFWLTCCIAHCNGGLVPLRVTETQRCAVPSRSLRLLSTTRWCTLDVNDRKNRKGFGDYVIFHRVWL